MLYQYFGSFVAGCGAETYAILSSFGRLEVYRCIHCGVFASFDTFNRIPYLAELADFTRINPAIVRLVIRIGTYHQFEVMPILVGENLVPHVSARVVSPEEELLARYHMAVGHMHRPGILRVIISGEELHLASPREDRTRVACIVRPTGKVCLLSASQHCFAHWPAREVHLAMVCTKLYIGWEYHLVMFVAMYRHVRPVEHGLNHRRRVRYHNLRLYPRTVGIDRYADRPFQAMAQLCLAHPNRLATIGILLHFPIGWQVGRGAMMVRDIPFHTA